jgi:hypothetical protein
MKKVLFVLAISLGSSAFSSSAQIVVAVRPDRPHYERVVAPSPRHVWIDEEWEPRGGSYVFVGGHWAEPPHPGGAWVPGHWVQRPRGWVWKPGHWR